MPRFLASGYGLSQSLSFLDKRIAGSGNEIAPIESRISWSCESGIRASALDVKSFRLNDINDESETESICNFSKNIVFAHQSHWCQMFFDKFVKNFSFTR